MDRFFILKIGFAFGFSFFHQHPFTLEVETNRLMIGYAVADYNMPYRSGLSPWLTVETHSKHVIARIPPSLDKKIEAGRGSKSRSDATRDALDFTVDIGVFSAPPDQLRSTVDIVKTVLAATATFSAAADPILADHYGFNCNYHREWLIAEIADSDLSFVLNIKSAVDKKQAGIESALVERLDRFFAANPGAEFYELARDDLTWLELRRGSGLSVPQNGYVSYVAASVERACVRERYLWHRRLLSELAASGVDYKALFAWNEAEKMYRLIERPRLRRIMEGGRLEAALGEPAPASTTPEQTPLSPHHARGRSAHLWNASSKLRAAVCNPPLSTAATGEVVKVKILATP
jgi:hypothetical protein